MKERPPPPKVPPPPMNRNTRRAEKKRQLKLLQGGKPGDAPHVDTTTPAGRFAFALHTFLVNYRVKNADVPPSDFCAAALQVAAKLSIEVSPDATAEDFGRAAEVFFAREYEARKGRPAE